MVVAAPATMEEGRILLVGNETDILHSAFSFPLNEGGKRYPSADHYAHAQILTQLGLDEVHVLELLATPSGNVSMKARSLLQANMPPGHDMNSLAQYLVTSRQSYTMLGLRLRAEQDKRFRETLSETGDALLIVCDRRDPELGIGMDDEQFVAFARQRHANAERISAWMHEEKQRPRELGQNQLGFFLMWLRYELREKKKAKLLSTVEIRAEGISMDQDDQPMSISISDFVLALQGSFQPLSNFIALPFELKGETYRSVEHYAYQRLFEALKLPFEEVMRLRTTVKPVDVAKCAQKVLVERKLAGTSEIENKMVRLGRWRQSAMKHKITKSDYLQKLLLSTGHAILLETTTGGDPNWVVGTDEFEIQHLLTKNYVSPQLLLKWMCGRAKAPPSLAHLSGNKTGLLLMELRAKLSAGQTHRMPLISPLTSGTALRSTVSNNMICFTPESVLHPFYPSPIRHPTFSYPGGDAFPSAAHLAAQMACKFLGVNQGDMEWIMEEGIEGPECWERLHSVICDQMQLPLEKIQQWYMEQRQTCLKEAMKLQFEQHPALSRVLLDTQDALLVCCARFSAVEAELNIGMRERDLRLWLSHVRQDTKSLMDLCLRPMAFRPPFFGGNRLGLLLMELRREFILAGVFPQHLPELPLNVDTILGSESPMENYVATAKFDILSDINFSALWANPYLLMMKQQQQEEGLDNEQCWTNALSKKQAPLLVYRDDKLIDDIFSRIFFRDQQAHPIENGGDGVEYNLDEMSSEMLRSLYLKMSSQFRAKLGEMDDLQQQISVRSRDSSRLQELRRTLERTRERLDASDQNAPNGRAPAASTATSATLGQSDSGISVGAPAHPASSAQWTQAAALSASGRSAPSPPVPGPMDHQHPASQQRISRPPPPDFHHPHHRPPFPPMPPPPPYHAHMEGPPPPGKIPSLLAQELVEPGRPGGGRRPPSPPHQQQHPPSYRRGGDYPPPHYAQGGDHRRGGGGGWERGARRGRRGAGGHGVPSGPVPPRRSMSPPYARRGGGGMRMPVSPVRVSGSGGAANAPERPTSRPAPYHKGQPQQQQRAPPADQKAQKPADVVQQQQPPPPKRPKRVVDESELSEGEILSDDE